MVTTVDLPAHNVYKWVGADSTVITGGPSCLTTTDDATGVTFSAVNGGIAVGATHDGGGGGAALGFGLFTLPAGATLVDARFVARLDVSSVGAIPPDSYSYGDIFPMPTRYPVVGVEYAGLTWPPRRYGLQVPNSGSGQVEVVGEPIKHLLGTADYVIAGIGTPDTGTNGLCPHVFIDDSWWQWPVEDHPVYMSYLAIRVTYDMGSTATGWSIGEDLVAR